MAGGEIYRVEIPIIVDDQTDAPLKQAERKISKLEQHARKENERIRQYFMKIAKLQIEPIMRVRDHLTSGVLKADRLIRKLDMAQASPLIAAQDRVSAVVTRTNAMLDALDKGKVDVVAEMQGPLLDEIIKAKAALSALNNVKAGPVAELRGELFGQLGKAMSQIRGLDLARAEPQASLRDRVMPKIREISSSLHGLASKAWTVTIQAKDKVTNVVSSLANKLTSPLTLLGAGAGVGAGILYPLKLAGEFEQARMSLDFYMGSVEEGERAFQDLIRFAKDTPFEFPFLQEMTIQLMGTGYNFEQAKRALLAFGDAAGRTGAGMQGIEAALLGFTQIASAGTLNLQDLKQVALNLKLPLNIFAKELGVAEDQLGNIGSAGISSAEAMEAIVRTLEQRFAGGMKELSNSLLGMTAVIKDTATLTVWHFGKGMAEPVKRIMFDIIGLTDETGGKFEEFQKRLELAGEKVGLKLEQMYGRLKEFWASISADPEFQKLDFGGKIIYILNLALDEINAWLDSEGGMKLQETFTKLGEIGAKAWIAGLKGAFKGAVSSAAHGNLVGAGAMLGLASMLGGGLVLRGAWGLGKGIWKYGKGIFEKFRPIRSTAGVTETIAETVIAKEAVTAAAKSSKPGLISRAMLPFRKIGEGIKSAPISDTLKVFGTKAPKVPAALGTVAKIAGKAAVPLAIGVELLDVIRAQDKVTATAKAAGGLGGGLAGAKLGALAGTAILPGIGTIVGGILGGLGGYIGGKWLGGKAVEAFREQPGAPADSTQFIQPMAEAVNKVSAILGSFSVYLQGQADAVISNLTQLSEQAWNITAIKTAFAENLQSQATAVISNMEQMGQQTWRIVAIETAFAANLQRVANSIVANGKSLADALALAAARAATFQLPSISLPSFTPTPHATGGILTRPHLGLVAETGPEAIIPLSYKMRNRALDLWQKVGTMLGVMPELPKLTGQAVINPVLGLTPRLTQLIGDVAYKASIIAPRSQKIFGSAVIESAFGFLPRLSELTGQAVITGDKDISENIQYVIPVSETGKRFANVVEMKQYRNLERLKNDVIHDNIQRVTDVSETTKKFADVVNIEKYQRLIDEVAYPVNINEPQLRTLPGKVLVKSELNDVLQLPPVKPVLSKLSLYRDETQDKTISKNIQQTTEAIETTRRFVDIIGIEQYQTLKRMRNDISHYIQQKANISETTRRLTNVIDIEQYRNLKTRNNTINENQMQFITAANKIQTVKAYATGGILTKPHIGLVAEAGPEVIIPLSTRMRARALELYEKTGRMLGVVPHANGGILTRPHLGLVAEAGPEAIIPLTSRMRSRAMGLWEETGRRLGVRPYAKGCFAEAVPVAAPAMSGASGIGGLFGGQALADRVNEWIDGIDFGRLKTRAIKTWEDIRSSIAYTWERVKEIVSLETLTRSAGYLLRYLGSTIFSIEWWLEKWGNVKTWASGVLDDITACWESIKESFQAGRKAKQAAAAHAVGGILTHPHLGMVAEAGPEAIIPLSVRMRPRALELWQQTGELLGVMPHASGGIFGNVLGGVRNVWNKTKMLFKSDRVSSITNTTESAAIALESTRKGQELITRSIKNYEKKLQKTRTIEEAEKVRGITHEAKSLVRRYGKTTKAFARVALPLSLFVSIAEIMGPSDKRQAIIKELGSILGAIGTGTLVGAGTGALVGAGAMSPVTAMLGTILGAGVGAFGGQAAASALYDRLTPYTTGGILTRPHLGLVAEAGPEAIIPLSTRMRARALELYEKTGRMLGVVPHANGGILTRPHLGLVAEAGPEAIIPLTSRMRSRAMGLWEETGRRLGVRPYAKGCFAEAVPVAAPAMSGASGIGGLFGGQALADRVNEWIDGIDFGRLKTRAIKTWEDIRSSIAYTWERVKEIVSLETLTRSAGYLLRYLGSTIFSIEWWLEKWGNVKTWASGVLDDITACWESIKESFQAGRKAKQAAAAHAVGGILTHPHLGMVAEAGPEAIIPLSVRMRPRALELWQQTGELLGVMPHASGGIFGNVLGGVRNVWNKTKMLFKSDRVSSITNTTESAAIALESTRKGQELITRSIKNYEKKLQKTRTIEEAEKVRGITHEAKSLVRRYGKTTKAFARVALPLSLFVSIAEIMGPSDKRQAIIKELGSILGAIGTGTLVGAGTGALVGAGAMSPVTAMLGTILGAGVGAFGGQAAASALYDRLTPYTTGGILTRPHLGLVAEAGPEAIIPLSTRMRARALALYEETGRRLGVRPYAEGGFAGDLMQNREQKIPVSLTPSLAMPGSATINLNFDLAGLVSQVVIESREDIDGAVNRITDAIANNLRAIFQNMTK